MTLTTEHTRPWLWGVKRDGDLVGMVLGRYDNDFFATDHEGHFIGKYCSLTKAVLAVARADEIRTLKALWTLP